jgi:hypothetical protein
MTVLRLSTWRCTLKVASQGRAETSPQYSRTEQVLGRPGDEEVCVARVRDDLEGFMRLFAKEIGRELAWAAPVGPGSRLESIVSTR